MASRVGLGFMMLGFFVDFGFGRTMERYRSLTGVGFWVFCDDVGGGLLAFIKVTRFLLMPAPKTRWSWRGIKYSSSSDSMAWSSCFWNEAY